MTHIFLFKNPPAYINTLILNFDVRACMINNKLKSKEKKMTILMLDFFFHMETEIQNCMSDESAAIMSRALIS